LTHLKKEKLVIVVKMNGPDQKRRSLKKVKRKKVKKNLEKENIEMQIMIWVTFLNVPSTLDYKDIYFLIFTLLLPFGMTLCFSTIFY